MCVCPAQSRSSAASADSECSAEPRRESTSAAGWRAWSPLKADVAKFMVGSHTLVILFSKLPRLCLRYILGKFKKENTKVFFGGDYT